jgi:opacity protein-like surface antigen
MRRLHCLGLVLVAGAAAGSARAQTMLDQEQRLIEIHSLLVAMPALEAPATLRSLQPSLGLEVITIPVIDGTTGGKTQITASDRARAFPRLRLALGLPAGDRWSAFAGVGWVPPVEFRGVSSNMVGLEAGLAWSCDRFATGLRLHGEWADSRSPVTDPTTRDRLVTWVTGADASVGWRFDLGPVGLHPYASVGVAHVKGTFTVTGDGHVLVSDTTDLTMSAGVSLVTLKHLELAAELVAYPGVMVHPAFRIAWVPGLGSKRSPE